MAFHAEDTMNVSSSLKQYAVVLQSALVGMSKKEKVKVTNHLAKHIVSWSFTIAN
jgi:nicotianamine synthase